MLDERSDFLEAIVFLEATAHFDELRGAFLCTLFSILENTFDEGQQGDQRTHRSSGVLVFSELYQDFPSMVKDAQSVEFERRRDFIQASPDQS